MKITRELSGRVASYFKQKLRVRPHKTGWLRQGTCPSCGREKKFGVNPILNRTNCFVCGFHPRPLELIIQLEGLSTYNEVYSFLNAFEHASYLETPLEFLAEKEVQLPESYTLLSFGDSNMAKLARRYIQKRGYDVMNLTLRGVGYCTTGPYRGRIIIPYYEAGKLIYFNARQFINLEGGAHKNPGIEEVAMGKSMVMYNVDALHIYETCYLLESATNALTMGNRGFSTGGKLLSSYQLSKILKSPCKNIIILFDPDAHWEALKTGLDLVGHKRVKVVLLPKKLKPRSDKFLDVNDYGKKMTLEFIKNNPYLSYSEIFSLFLKEPKPLHRLPAA